MLRQALLVSLFLGWSALTVAAQTTAGGKIQIVERGIYRAETIKKTEAPGTTGLINTVQNVRLIASTTSVVGSLGVRFGLRYIVRGEGSDASLKLVIAFPPVGLRDPQSRQVFFHSEHMVTVPSGVALYWEYHFEHEWEIVAGLWHFQFWHQDQLLAEQRFCVQELASRSPTLGLPKECGAGLLGSTLIDRPKSFYADWPVFRLTTPYHRKKVFLEVDRGTEQLEKHPTNTTIDDKFDTYLKLGDKLRDSVVVFVTVRPSRVERMIERLKYIIDEKQYPHGYARSFLFTYIKYDRYLTQTPKLSDWAVTTDYVRAGSLGSFNFLDERK